MGTECERFRLRRTRQVPHFTNRLLALRAKQTYDAQAAHAQHLLEDVSCACSQLLLSSGFETLLALILAAGNAINEGTSRAAFRGYKLGALTKLADVKSMAPNTAMGAGRGATLLGLLVRLGEARLPSRLVHSRPHPPFPPHSLPSPPSPHCPRLAAHPAHSQVNLAESRLPTSAAVWAAELGSAAAASRVSWDRIEAELAQMKKSLELCGRVHKAVAMQAKMAQAKARAAAAKASGSAAEAPGVGADDVFGDAMGRWLDDASSTHGRLQRSLAAARRLFRAVAQHLGEDASGGVGPETLFGTLDTFRQQWLGASEAIAKAKDQRARELARAQRKVEREAALEAKRAAAVAAAARAAASGAGEASHPKGGTAGRRGAVSRLTVRLPTNKKRKGARAAGGARDGAQKTCVSCAKPFLGWGRTCGDCRKGRGGGTAAGAASASRRASADKFQSAEGIEHCFICTKRVYPAERFVAGGRLFHRKSPGHRGCFRCTQCDCPLNEANFSNAGDKMFCNTHFKQLFATTGDYRFAEGEGGGEAGVGAVGGGAAGGRGAAGELDGGGGESCLETVRSASGQLELLEKAPPSPPLKRGGSSVGQLMSLPDLGGPLPAAAALASSADEMATRPAAAAAAAGGAEGAEGAEGTNEEEDDGVAATHYVYGDLRIPFEIEAAWLRVRDPDAPANWLLVGPSIADADQVELIGEGAGGLAECRSSLVACGGAGRVVYGGLRIVAVDTRRGIRSERPKFVFFMATGADVPIRAATRGLLERGAIAEVVQQTHCSFEVEGIEELTADAIAAKLLASGGAHKPNGFDFGGGQVLEREWY